MNKSDASPSDTRATDLAQLVSPLSTKPQSPKPSKIFGPAIVPYRFRVGAVGHRHLDDADAVRTAVEALLDKVAGMLESASEIPLEWTVVTPAAKGADRLITHAVLNRQAGARVEVICPFAIDEYRCDFKTQGDSEEFEAIIERASRVMQMHTDALPTDQAERNLCYLDAGRAVVDACELLIVVWDGKQARGIGGTEDAVRYAASLGRLVLCVDALNPDAPPRRIMHTIEPQDSDVAGPRVTIAAESVPEDAATLSPGYLAQSAYLTEKPQSSVQYAEAYRIAASNLRIQVRAAGLPDTVAHPLLSHLLPHHVRACMMALCHQKLHVAASMLVFLLSAAAVTVAVFQGMFRPNQWQLTIVELAFVLAAIAAFVVNRRRDWHRRWLTERYLAEQLRTALHTVLLGEAYEKANMPPHSAEKLPFYAGPEGWLPAMVRTLVDQMPTLHPTPDPHGAGSLALNGWLRDQAAWHQRNAESKVRAARHLRWLAIGTLMLTIVIGTATILMTIAEQGGEFAIYLSFAAIVLPAWATAVHGISRLLEYDRVGARSAQMAQVLGRFYDRASVAGTGPAFRRIIHDAADTAALENYEWWVVLSFDSPDLI